jgi:hypothetical protein
MADHITSPEERQPPKDWWLENACRIAAFRLRQATYLSANTIPIHEQVKSSVEVVRLVWEEIERSLREEESRLHSGATGPQVPQRIRDD